MVLLSNVDWCLKHIYEDAPPGVTLGYQKGDQPHAYASVRPSVSIQLSIKLRMTFLTSSLQSYIFMAIHSHKSLVQSGASQFILRESVFLTPLGGVIE